MNTLSTWTLFPQDITTFFLFSVFYTIFFLYFVFYTIFFLCIISYRIFLLYFVFRIIFFLYFIFYTDFFLPFPLISYLHNTGTCSLNVSFPLSTRSTDSSSSLFQKPVSCSVFYRKVTRIHTICFWLFPFTLVSNEVTLAFFPGKREPCDVINKRIKMW